MNLEVTVNERMIQRPVDSQRHIRTWALLLGLVLIAMLGFIRAGSTEQLWVGVLISLVSLLLLTYFRPYVDASRCG